MSQSHDTLTATQLAAATEVTWLIGWGSMLSLMPTCAAFDCSSVISDASELKPLPYGKLKLSVVPWATPGPHLAGSTQVVGPPGTTFQPWLVSSALALAMLDGNGSPFFPSADRNLLTGGLTTRPSVTEP